MPGCIPCKTHAGGMPLAPQMHARAEGLHAPEVQRLKELCIEICIQLYQYVEQYNLGSIHTAMLTRRLAPCQRSLGVSAWNAL